MANKWVRIDKEDGSESEELESRVQRVANTFYLDAELAIRSGRVVSPFAIYEMRELVEKTSQGRETIPMRHRDA